MSWNSISICDLDINYYIYRIAIIILVRTKVLVTLSNREQVIKIEVDSVTL